MLEDMKEILLKTYKMKKKIKRYYQLIIINENK